MTTYVGESLRWVRTLLGYPAKYASARDAYEDAHRRGLVERTHQPPLGSLAWFGIGQHGDVGLVVLNDLCVRLRAHGQPGFSHPEEDSGYLGWSPADVLGPDEGTTMTHTEYGVLLTAAEHTYLDSTHRTKDTAEEAGARRMALPLNTDIVTLAQRQVTYTLGEWESIA